MKIDGLDEAAGSCVAWGQVQTQEELFVGSRAGFLALGRVLGRVSLEHVRQRLESLRAMTDHETGAFITVASNAWGVQVLCGSEDPSWACAGGLWGAGVLAPV